MNLNMQVIKVLDEFTVVINKGSEDGIRFNHRFLIYSLDDEPLIDPITEEPLGTLELVKGTAKVKHIQEHLTTLESDSFEQESRKIIKHNPRTYTTIYGNRTEEEVIQGKKEQKPFDNPNVGDFVKNI